MALTFELLDEGACSGSGRPLGAKGRPAIWRAAAATPSVSGVHASGTQLRVVTRGSASLLRPPSHARRRRHAGPTPASVTAAAASASRTFVPPTAPSRSTASLLAGGLAGACSKTCVAPLERVSTMLMADRAGRFSVLQAWRLAISEDGLAGLWRGHAATLLRVMPASAINFAVFTGAKDLLLSRKRRRRERREASQDCSGSGTASSSNAPLELGHFERLLAGAAAGACSSAATYPFESLRVMMSVAGGIRGGVPQVVRQVVSQHGVRAFYRGFKACLLNDIAGNAIGFSLYECGIRLYQKGRPGEDVPSAVRGAIGAAAAVCTLTAIMPIEVVRRRLAIQGTAGRPVLYRGAVHCFSRICREEGPGAFFAASLPLYLKVAPSVGLSYGLFDFWLRRLLPPEAQKAAGGPQAAHGPHASATLAPAPSAAAPARRKALAVAAAT